MRPLLLLGLFFALLPIGWSRLAPPVVYMDTWPDGSAKVRAVSTRTADGEYVFDGLYTGYHPSGRKEREGEMRAGKEEGPWTWWNEDGSVRAAGEFHRGSGEITTYYPGGEMWWQGQYRDGMREGVWAEFSPEGRKLREGPYRMDREHGAWTYWNEDETADTLVVQWANGQMLEEGEAPPPSSHPSGSAVSPWRHTVQSLSWWWILLGPLPWGLAVAGAPPHGVLSRAHRVLVATVTWSAIQIAVVLALGWIHALRIPAILAVETVLLITGTVGWRRLARRWTPWPDLATAPVRMMAFSGLVTLLAAFWWLVSIPTDNFDSLAYHLPTVARWIQEGTLIRLAELGQTSFYPFHWETLAALQVLPFAEDLTVALPNLVAWAVLALAIYALARDLGADRSGAWFATLCVGTMPAALSRLPAVQPDLAVAAFFVAASALGRVALRRGTMPVTLAWALSLGVLLGLKGSALAYAALAVAFAVGDHLVSDRSGRAPVGGGRWIAALLVTGLLGGVWYARNWMQTGNPLGFVQVELLGVTVWPGPVDTATLQRGTLLRLFDPAQLGHWRLLGGMARSELALPFVALVLGAMGLGRPAVRVTLGARRLWVMLGWMAAAFLLYWITPYGADNGTEGWRLTPRIAAGLRFGFPALSALAVVAALGVTRLPRLGFALVALAVASAGLGLVRNVESGWLASAFAVVGALALFAAPRVRPFVRASGVGLFLLIGTTVVLLTARGERDRWRSTLYGEAYEFVEKVVPRADVIGYALTQARFPYYGRNLDRELVSVVPTNASYDQWLDELDDASVRWMLLGTTSAGEAGTPFEAMAREWVEAHPERFEPVFEYQSRSRDISVIRVLD